MVFAAVERAGGQIWVYSEPGHGTTFRMYLPTVVPGTPAGAGAVETPARPTGGSESILIVEDDDLVRDLVAKVLRGLGYDVTVASRPSEAFELAAGRRFDLLVSDIVMPELTGDSVAARQRASQPDICGRVHVGVHGTGAQLPAGATGLARPQAAYADGSWRCGPRRTGCLNRGRHPEWMKRRCARPVEPA